MAMSKFEAIWVVCKWDFLGFFEVSISHKNQASSSREEFFCTIWLIRQLTNEGWFVSLLPENVSIFRPSFFSISSPSKMSLTSRPNICYYMYHEHGEVKLLVYLKGWKIREKLFQEIIQECTYNLLLTWRPNPEVHYFDEIFGIPFWKPRVNLWWIHTCKRRKCTIININIDRLT